MYYNYPHKGRIYNLGDFVYYKVSEDLKVPVASDYEKELKL
jgi:hypothetical protein